MENNFKYSKDDVFSGRSGLSYTVISQMKYGPYTEIYKIRRNNDGCPCIMKILRYADMPEGLMATSSPLIHTYLESSNIAGQFMVYDWGETPDDFYIISRYFAKGVLRSRLNEGSLRPKSAVGIILDLAKALASLEGYYKDGTPYKFCHLDINPNNIMYDIDEGGKFKAYLIDLEHIASIGPDNRVKQVSLDDVDLFYSAPETLDIKGGPHRRSDVFSLGVILYECIFGEYPWTMPDNRDEMLQERGLSLRQYLFMLLKTKHKAVDESLPVAKMLHEIITRMIEPDPEKRISMGEAIVKLNTAYQILCSADMEVYDTNTWKFCQQNIIKARLRANLVHSAGYLPSEKMEEAGNPNPGKERNTGMNHSEHYSPLIRGPRKANEGGFRDVAGMEDLKDTLQRKVMYFLKDTQLAEEYRITPPNGMLLYGPPGCGKTFIAEKFAEESGFSYALLKGSDIGSSFVHGTQGNIAALFNEAKQKAPCVICFDEFDTFAPERRTLTDFHYSSEVNEFLSQLNDCGKRGIFVIATTNNPEKVDKAVLRSGRLDYKVYIPAPDHEARKAIFEMDLKRRPCSEDIDTERLAELTNGYVTSDICLVINEAAMNAAYSRIHISQKILEEVISEYRPSVTASVIKEYEELHARMQGSDPGRTNKIGF